MPATIQTIQKPTRARALDTSGNNNHGQIYSGRALEFDGVTDYLTFTHTGMLENFTVSAWVNINSFSSINQLHSGGAAGLYPSIKATTGEVQWYNGSAWLEGSTLELNTWYRLVYTFSKNGSAGDYHIYINGVNTLSSIGTGTYTDGYFDEFGAINGASRIFNGMASDIQIWNTVWTADDALYDYNNPEQLALNREGTSLTNSNLKIWYPMDDGHRGQQSYILDASNTGLGDNLFTDAASTFESGTYGWVKYSNNTIENDNGALKVTYVDHSNGAYFYLRSAYSGFSKDLIVGTTYKISVDFKNSGGTCGFIVNQGSSQYIISTTSTVPDFTTYTHYFNATNATTNYLAFTAMSAGEVAWIKNIKVEPVNDKNHATTVFHGDEQISVTNDRTFAGANNWTDSGTTNNQWTQDSGTYDEAASSGATEGTYFTDNYLKLVATSDASHVREANLDGANWEDADGDGPAMVVGRTYRLSYSIEITAYTSGTLSVGFCNTSDAISSSKKTYTATKTAATDYFDFVYEGTTNHAKIQLLASTSSAFTVYFDNFSLKEVGTATGWTDADQQLDIPQTALQSYNQLAWFDEDNDTSIIADTSNDHDDIWSGGGSVSAWIYPNGIGEGSYGRIVDKSSSTDGADGYNMYLYDESGGTAYLNFNKGHSTTDGVWRTTNRVITYGKWYHVVVSYNQASASNNPTMYINGESVAVTETQAPVGSPETDASQPLTIGNRSGATDRTFDGCITEVSLWGSGLSEDNVKELYNDGKALSAIEHSTYLASPGTLDGYWRNNGLAQWTDLSDNSNHGTPTNITETMLITAGADGSRDSQGFLMNRQRTTNSLNLEDDMEDGVGDTGSYMAALQSPFTADTDYNAMTVTLWFKIPDNTIRDSLFSIIHDNSTHFTVETLTTGKLGWTYEGSTAVTDARYKTDADMYSNDKWTFVAFALDHDIGADVNRVKCYVGDEDTVVSLRTADTTHATTTTSPNKDNSLQIGSSEINNINFTGQVDDVCVYNRTLDLPEIKRNYNAGKRSHK